MDFKLLVYFYFLKLGVYFKRNEEQWKARAKPWIKNSEIRPKHQIQA